MFVLSNETHRNLKLLTSSNREGTKHHNKVSSYKALETGIIPWCQLLVYQILLGVGKTYVRRLLLDETSFSQFALFGSSGVVALSGVLLCFKETELHCR